jgi:hypothetical protein
MFQQRAGQRDHRGLYDRRADMAFIDIAKTTGRGLAVTAVVLAAVSLTTAPGTAYAERGDHEGGGRHGGGDHEGSGHKDGDWRGGGGHWGGGDWHGGGHRRGEGWGGGRPYYYRHSYPYYGYYPYEYYQYRYYPYYGSYY